MVAQAPTQTPPPLAGETRAARRLAEARRASAATPARPIDATPEPVVQHAPAAVSAPVAPAPAAPALSRRARRAAEAQARPVETAAPAAPLAGSIDQRRVAPATAAAPATVTAPSAPAVVADAPTLPAIVVPAEVAPTASITPVAELAESDVDDIELPLSFVRNQAALKPVAPARRGSKRAFVRVKRTSSSSASRRGAALRGGAGLAALGFAATVAVASTLPAAAAPDESVEDTILGEAGGAQSFTSGGGAAEVATASTSLDDRAPAYGVATMGSATAYNMTVGVPRPDPAAYSNSLTAPVQWPFPVGVVISDMYGDRVAPCYGCSSDHKGVDFTPGEGTPIGSIAAGRVLTVTPTDNGGLGVHVTVEHVIDGERIVSVYGHMLEGSIAVEVGQVINVGDEVGKVGNTGSSTGAHLHLEIHVGETPVDPYAYLAEHNVATTIVDRPDPSVTT